MSTDAESPIVLLDKTVRSQNKGGISKTCALTKPCGMQTPKTLPSFAAIQHTFTPSNAQKILEEMRQWTLDNFEIKDRLGKGYLGHVYLAREKTTKFRVALKIMYKHQLDSGHLHDQLKREIENHAHIKHPNILRLYAYFHDDFRVYLVLEYAPRGNLFDLLRRKGRFDDKAASRYVAQVANALAYCHSKGIIHPDIKPENILLDKNGDVKLAGFGWSVQQDPPSYRTTLYGTFAYMQQRLYMAPEMLRKQDLRKQGLRNQGHDEKVDIWCIGVLSFELLVGNSPIQVKDQEDDHLITWNWEVKLPVFASAAAKDFVSCLLKKDPSSRISIKAALTHRWISKYSKVQTLTPRRILWK